MTNQPFGRLTAGDRIRQASQFVPWVLCLLGVVIAWQLGSLNASLQRQNDIVQNQNQARVALVNNLNAVSASISRAGRATPAKDAPDHTQILTMLMLEVRRLREAVEKQKK